jgi:hypothetical protein
MRENRERRNVRASEEHESSKVDHVPPSATPVLASVQTHCHVRVAVVTAAHEEQARNTRHGNCQWGLDSSTKEPHLHGISSIPNKAPIRTHNKLCIRSL